MSGKGLLTLIVLFIFQSAFAQDEITADLDFERIIEDLLPQQDIDVNYNDLYDRLVTLYTEPVDLNKADRNDLHSLFFLSELQITGILDYRKKYGNFLTEYELLSIEGFDKETVRRLKPFFTLSSNDKESFKNALANPDINDLFLRFQTVLEPKKGYSDPDTTSSGNLTSRYVGNPNRLYARYLYSKAERYSMGFTVEKDPGEQITWDSKTSRYGFDYYSFHLMMENIWILKKVVIGDFTMDFGQSLVFGSGFSFGKGYEPVTTVRRNAMGLKPYRSVYENKDFSGIAISVGNKPVELNVFYSYLRRDALLREPTDSEEDFFISSVRTTGLHRTPSEINAKHDLKDQSIGANLNFKTGNDKLEVGLNGVFTKFSNAILPDNKKYNQYEFRGLSNTLGSTYINYYLRNAHIFGEAAMSQGGGKSILAGFVASLSSQVQTSLHLRTYDKNFHSFFGEGFGENTKNMNEEGIYWGISVKPAPNLILASYFDFFSFPWLKYLVDLPSSGSDFMFSSSYSANEKINVRFQYRNKTKELNFNTEREEFSQILPKQVQRFIVDMEFSLHKNYSTKTRMQYSTVNFAESNTNGFILAQDINFSKEKFSVSCRFALFDTDNYDNRQFIYERDLLYVYSIPFFYNKGARFYVLTKYDLNKHISLWLKFAKTKYTNKEAIGSGLEEIDGNKVTSISFQARFKL